VSTLFEKIWCWGVVLPAALLALGGVVADAATRTLSFWPLLVPSYFVIGILAWRRMSPKAMEEAELAEDAARLAQIEELEAEAEGRAPRPLREAKWVESREPKAAESLVVQPPRITLGSVVGGVFGGIFRIGAAITGAFIYMIALQAVIEFSTWGRGYWFIYVPVLAGLAWLVWMVRSNRVTAKAGDQITG
jgi:hypothetical protein